MSLHPKGLLSLAGGALLRAFLRSREWKRLFCTTRSPTRISLENTIALILEKRIVAFLTMTTKRYQQLLEEVSEGVVESDSDTRVLFANRAAMRMLQLSRGKLSYLRLFDRVHPEDRHKVKQYAKLLKSGRRRHMVTLRRIKRGDGTYIALQRSTRLLPDGRQISIWRDVTAEKEFERRRDMFVSIASHELRTPLASMRISADMLAQELARTPHRKRGLSLLKDILCQINRQKELIEDLLNLSKIRAGKFEFRMDWLDLSEVVHEAVSYMRSLTRGKYRIAMRGHTASLAYGDNTRLYQVFVNLLSNAVKYSPAGGVIEVHLHERRRDFLVSVKDFGVGISKEEQKKIFRRFYRADEGSTAGLGIGLYLCKEIVERHGGAIRIKSASGKGSTFIVSLPKRGHRARTSPELHL
jgi:PAS domain S-box-containing protein